MADWYNVRLGSKGFQFKTHCAVSFSKTLHPLLSTGVQPNHHNTTAWVKVFRIPPEFRILRLTFHRKSASNC